VANPVEFDTSEVLDQEPGFAVRHFDPGLNITSFHDSFTMYRVHVVSRAPSAS
jgi:hypothetical protein